MATKSATEKEPIFKTMREAVVDMFFKQVLDQEIPKVIKGDKTLADFVPKQYKSFADDMVVMYLDKISRVFNVSSTSMKNKPLEDILQILEHAKKQASKYGNRPVKKSQFRKF